MALDSLNYLLSEEEVRSVFRCCKKHLAPRGLLVFDTNTVAGHRHWNGRETVLQEADPRIISIGAYDPEQRRGSLKMYFQFASGLKVVEEHVQRSYDQSDIPRLLAAEGLGIRSATYCFSDRKADSKAPRICWVCSHASAVDDRGSSG